MTGDLDDVIGTIRAAGPDGPDGDDEPLAAATQLRVRRSLEGRARGRHRLVGVVTTIAILFAGTVSWALATGKVAALWTRATPPREPATSVAPVAQPVQRHRQALATTPAPPPAPETVPPPPAPAVPPPRTAAAPAVESLYRAAHELHFHGGDPSAALAAWDAYLAAEPTGRFSVEARYNRAIILVRLRRYTEARDALLPFARGEVHPAGYRQTEAEQLVERLAPP